jgi:2-methylcitrate dehydratase
VLVKKFEAAIAARLSAKKCAALNAMCADQAKLEALPVNEFMELFAV